MLDMSQQQRVSQKQILKPAIIYLLKTEMDLLLSLFLSLSLFLPLRQFLLPLMEICGPFLTTITPHMCNNPSVGLDLALPYTTLKLYLGGWPDGRKRETNK